MSDYGTGALVAAAMAMVGFVALALTVLAWAW